MRLGGDASGRDATGSGLGWWLLAPFAVGMALRLWRLPQQILGGDEFHAVLTALHHPLGTVLTTYFPSDSSIPLTALVRLWLLAGGELTEMGLRLPVLLTAAVFLLAIPPRVARALGPRTGVAFAWLAAVSPGLVLYGRIVRSYMPVVLWGSLAAIAFWGWWRSGRRRWAALYVLAAGLGLWFHLGAGPFLVAPFLFAAGERVHRWLRDGREASREPRVPRPGWLPLLVLGGLTAGTFLLLLLPAADSLLALAADKRIEQSVPLGVVGGAFRLAAGTVHPLAAALFWLVALGGLVRLVGHHPSLGLYTLALGVGQAVGIRVLSPLGLGHPVILFRYHLIALPLVLLWVAVALAGPESRDAAAPVSAAPATGETGATGAGGWWRWSGRLSASAAVLLVTGLVLAGPFPSWDFLRGSFTHHNDFVAYVLPRPRLVEERVPVIYHRLASGEPPGAVLEYPWTFFWNRNQVVPLYQRIHRREVLVAPAEEVLADPRLDLRNAVRPDREAFAASRARFLILHLDPGGEEAHVLTGPGRVGMLERMRAERQRLATIARRMAGWLERGWGPPVYRDRQVRVWDLEAVRSEGSTGEGSGSTTGSSKGER